MIVYSLDLSWGSIFFLLLLAISAFLCYFCGHTLLGTLFPLGCLLKEMSPALPSPHKKKKWPLDLAILPKCFFALRHRNKNY